MDISNIFGRTVGAAPYLFFVFITRMTIVLFDSYLFAPDGQTTHKLFATQTVWIGNELFLVGLLILILTYEVFQLQYFFCEHVLAASGCHFCRIPFANLFIFISLFNYFISLLW
jgi:hypothetical protein